LKSIVSRQCDMLTQKSLVMLYHAMVSSYVRYCITTCYFRNVTMVETPQGLQIDFFSPFCLDVRVFFPVNQSRLHCLRNRFLKI